TMANRALADNGKLLKNFPGGYALDDTHHAHVTMLQRFVRDADIEKLCAAVADAAVAENPSKWKLQAYKYYYIPAGPIGLAGIVVEVTDGLLNLQKKIIDAVAPFSIATATAGAFFKLPNEPALHEVQMLIEYVGNFVPEHSG